MASRTKSSPSLPAASNHSGHYGAAAGIIRNLTWFYASQGLVLAAGVVLWLVHFVSSRAVLPPGGEASVPPAQGSGGS